MDLNIYPSLVLDQENEIATFYLYNLSQKIVGYQKYNPNATSKKINNEETGRYYTYLPKGVDGVFGLEQINPNDRTIYIVEGVFKAVNLHRLGFNAIAVLTSSPKRLKTWFRILKPTWNLVAIGDNDPAGQKLVNIVKKGFLSPTDIDEMPDEDIMKMLKENT